MTRPLLLLPLLLTGCVGRYFADRGRDLQDIFTCQVGMGIGAKARVGPVQTGALLDAPVAGLKGGEWGWYPDDGDAGRVLDAQIIALGIDIFVPLPAQPARSKGYEAYTFIPFVQIPRDAYSGGALAYYTQLEVVVGAGASLRLGFNPGELMDFLGGWFGLDLFGDDVTPEETVTRF